MSRVQPVSPIQLSSSPPSPTTLRAVSSSSALFQPTLHTYPGLEPSSNHLIPLRSHHRRNKSYDERTHISSGGTHPSMQRVYSIEYKRSVSPRPVEVLATSSPLARQVATTPQLELRIRLRIDGCNKLLAGKLGTKRNPYVVVYVVERIQQLLYGNFETRIDHLRASRHGPGPLRAKYITAVRKRTRNPRWEGEDFDIPLKSQTDMGLYIEVFDHSQLHSDSFLGSASLTIPQILDIVDRTSDSHVDLELEGTQRSTTLLKKSLPVSGSVMVTVTSTASCKRLPSSPARSSSPSFSLTNSAELSSPLSAMATPPLYYPYTNLVWNTPNLQTFDILLFGDQLAPSHVAMVYKPNGSENQFSLVSSSSSSSEQISDAYLMFEFFSDPTDILTPAAVRLQSSAARLDAYFSPTNREFSPHRLVAARVLTGPRQASSLVRLETITHQLQGLDAAAAAALFPSLCQAELPQPTIQTSFSAQLIATIFRACGILSEETNPLECSPRDFGCFDGSKLKFMPGFGLEPEILHSFERLKTFAE